MSPCIPFRDARGQRIGFLCTRGRRPQPKCACGREGRFQCDAPMPQGGTCDAWLCGKCATWARHQADTHYCPGHKDLA